MKFTLISLIIVMELKNLVIKDFSIELMLIIVIIMLLMVIIIIICQIITYVILVKF